MTSQAQAIEPLDGVRGLAFLGFPLYPWQAVGRQSGAPVEDPDPHAVRLGHPGQAR